jgi:hypothetical protein
VGGGDGVDFAGSHQLPEPGVAQAAGGLFNRFGRLAYCGIGLGLGGDIDAGLMKGQAKTGRKLAGKGQIGVGFLAAQAVVQVGGMEHQAQLRAAGGESPQQGHRIRAAGEAYGQAQTGLEQRSFDLQSWRFGSQCAHERIIARRPRSASLSVPRCAVLFQAALSSIAKLVTYEQPVTQPELGR